MKSDLHVCGMAKASWPFSDSATQEMHILLKFYPSNLGTLSPGGSGVLESHEG